MTAPKPKAKDRFITTAMQQFAARGFEAVSLADIAGALGLTKQSVIYHFKTKEALYGEVLEGMAHRYNGLLDGVERASSSPEDRWPLLIRALWDHGEDFPNDARLITHEVLGNVERAKAGRRWYLRDFLDRCVKIYAATPAGQGRDLAIQRAKVYQHIGALTYLQISGATLDAIWGQDEVADIRHLYVAALMA